MEAKRKSDTAFKNFVILQLLEDLQRGMKQGDTAKNTTLTEEQFHNSESNKTNS